jgi:hypothetical protein
MRRNLQTIVCAAGIGAVALTLTGCHRDSDRSWGWDMNRPASSTNTDLSATGVTGSSASPYTQGRARYTNDGATGYTGSSAAPNRYYNEHDTRYYRDNYKDDTTVIDTRPGMVDETKKDDCNPK